MPGGSGGCPWFRGWWSTWRCGTPFDRFHPKDFSGGLIHNIGDELLNADVTGQRGTGPCSRENRHIDANHRVLSNFAGSVKISQPLRNVARGVDAAQQTDCVNLIPSEHEPFVTNVVIDERGVQVSLKPTHVGRWNSCQQSAGQYTAPNIRVARFSNLVPAGLAVCNEVNVPGHGFGCGSGSHAPCFSKKKIQASLTISVRSASRASPIFLRATHTRSGTPTMRRGLCRSDVEGFVGVFAAVGFLALLMWSSVPVIVQSLKACGPVAACDIVAFAGKIVDIL